jgi:hypothetical protein
VSGRLSLRLVPLCLSLSCSTRLGTVASGAGAGRHGSRRRQSGALWRARAGTGVVSRERARLRLGARRGRSGGARRARRGRLGAARVGVEQARKLVLAACGVCKRRWGTGALERWRGS